MPAAPHTFGGWIGAAAATLISLSVFGRVLVQPVVRLLGRLRDEVERLTTAADDVQGMGPLLLDHEQRLIEIEIRQGIRRSTKGTTR